MNVSGRSATLIVVLMLSAAAFSANRHETGYSAASLYNQANAEGRIGKRGMAVLMYLRATLIAPGDADIESNLRLVREAAGVAPRSPSWVERAVQIASPTAAAAAALAGLLLVGGMLLTPGVAAIAPWMRIAAVGIGAGFIAFALCQAAYLWPILHSAVVVTGPAPALVSPVPMAEPLFMVPEAETVRVTGQREDYLLIRTPAGRTGWVSRASVVAVLADPQGFEAP